MSEPRHIYGAGEWIGGKWSGQYDDERVVGDRRYTLTSGPEWDALMERANFMLGHVHPESGEAHILRDLLAYLGEQP